jgi:hypothetical protein
MTKPFPELFALAMALAASGAAAATTPSGMMANVYRLTEAAAVLTVCTQSEAFNALPGEKAAQAKDLLARLGSVVGSIGTHYRDDSLPATFEATRAKIAGETAMRGYVKTKYQYCGDALFEDMRAYVEANEKLIYGYFEREAAAKAGRKVPPVPGRP